MNDETVVEPKRRGFAAMDPAKRSELARKGGRAVHAKGAGYRFSSEKAREAGRKGGLAVHAKRRAREEEDKVSE
jgi:general stress protein YciG